MDRDPSFSLIYAPIVKRHLLTIKARHRSTIRAKIVEQLSFEPDVETRNRKPLKRPVVYAATWELRFGPRGQFRVLYDIDWAARSVYILAIGIKRGNLLIIGGEEVAL